MSALVFLIASAVMLVFGIGVVLNRNPVASALCLVVSFVGLASLFISLDAHFLGIIQILVYAGAVMVLFLFIIMLLDLRAEERRKLNAWAVAGGGLVALCLVGTLLHVLERFPRGQATLPPLEPPAGVTYEDTKALGTLLFTDYVFHVQVIGILLLGATVGVVALSKREPTR
ncbi:MAG: NADH-quinone oxidoreductase subunit J [Verrucomicrobiales bacterium]